MTEAEAEQPPTEAPEWLAQLTQLVNSYAGLLGDMEKRVNTQEAQMATLVTAYVEMAATMESFIRRWMGEASEEDRTSFVAEVRDMHIKTWQSIKEATDHGVESLDPQLRSALGSLFGRQ